MAEKSSSQGKKNCYARYKAENRADANKRKRIERHNKRQEKQGHKNMDRIMRGGPVRGETRSLRRAVETDTQE